MHSYPKQDHKHYGPWTIDYGHDYGGLWSVDRGPITCKFQPKILPKEAVDCCPWTVDFTFQNCIFIQD